MDEHLEEFEYIRPTDEELLEMVVKDKMAEAEYGGEVPFDPEEAELAGYFEEEALSSEDVDEARNDHIA